MAKALVLSGYGINCETETLYAFELAGFSGKILHINELITDPYILEDYQVIAIPGGFSFGDHTGAGNAFACKARIVLEQIDNFLNKDRLVIGICNGAQILTRLFTDIGVTFEANISNRYQCGWYDLSVADTESIWLKNIGEIRLPIAHGEGNLQALNTKELKGKIAMQYLEDVNGSSDRIAAITEYKGRMLITMPHPERAVTATQMDDYYLRREEYRRKAVEHPSEGPGMQIFRNAYDYFS
ncbi:cobB/CobQ-like glutamine amidotransferase domain protein [Neorickettsia helminthoeca str. Oregon]|uniref:CobB/CobQ-like glutamine amidotransferase domain protein n=1 Tax=Neorickettsia helminthoeca str. Oregon TaxID=1286528 RepID=X5H473_9RICK|nr:phosphoribosylformylglycinamidine synthase subunit PurQ [Neorickettsia helminthoeca]AHX11366.1 cobB/CobQ-like glutamine amidotransferase domain protein [Neorickettsia helminthoeca str. Oregon]